MARKRRVKRSSPAGPKPALLPRRFVLQCHPVEAPGDASLNPFRLPDRKPDWAQLTRLAGDRAAILFEELRRAVGKIDDVIEDLYFSGAELGWAPRYRLGETTLFIAHIFPGRVEASIELEASWKRELLASPRVSTWLKTEIRKAPSSAPTVVLHVLLPTRAAVRSFAQLVAIKSRVVGPAA